MKSGDNSFKTIIKNVIEVKDYVNIVIRINVDKENSAHINELLDIFERFKLKESVFVYFTNVINCSNSCELEEDVASLLPDLYVEAFNRNFRVPFRIYSIGPCHLHKKNSFGLRPNGDLVKCLAVNSTVGNINNGSDLVQEKRIYSSKCKECSLFPICFGGCKYEYSDKNDTCPINMFKNLLHKYLKVKYLAVIRK